MKIKIVICAIILFSCSQSETKIQPATMNQSLHFETADWIKNKKIADTIVKEIQFIPLETNEDCLLGEITKIIVANNNFYILDRGSNQRISVFSMTGKYLKSIGAQGRGPGEYTRINDFAININDSSVLVLDAAQKKIVKYDLVGGDFKNALSLSFFSENFVISQEGVLSFYTKTPNPENCLIATLDLADNSENWFIEKDENDTYLSYPYSIFQSENTYFASYFDNIVYQITSEDVIPFISFDFGEHLIPKNKFENRRTLKEITQVINESDWSYGIENILENTNFLSLNFMLKKRNTLVIYSKLTGNYVYGSRFAGGLEGVKAMRYLTTNDNQFIGTIDPFNFKYMENIVMKQGNEELKIKYLKTFSELSDQPNPILISIQYNTF